MDREKKNRIAKKITNMIASDPEVRSAVLYDIQKLKVRTISLLANQMGIKTDVGPKDDFVEVIEGIINMLKEKEEEEERNE